MGVMVPRTVTVLGGGGSRARGMKLSDFRDAPFYVLLGEPGAGKTTAFEQEAGRGDDSLCVPAREFVCFHATPKLEWQGKTLFIDGLDEERAGSQDLRRPLNQILVGLHHLGAPKARISCRSAAWLATNDREAVKKLSRKYKHPEILHLDALTDQGARDILADRLPAGADSFFAEAHRRSLHGLLDNPLSLDLLTKAVGPGKGWPESRVETFEKACVAVLAEENHEHVAANRHGLVREQDALAAAGQMAALLLLAGKDRLALYRTDVSEPHNLLLAAEALESDDRSMLRAVDSGLFVSHASGEFVPVHAHVAEYLAARHLNEAIKSGAVLDRVLTLLRSGDGVPSPLRGVAAWLAALCRDARRPLIDIDPVGVVAYGDVGVFSDGERDHLLSRLAEDNGLNYRLSSFPIPALGGLVSPQTMNELRDYASGSDRSEPAQQTMELLLRGLAAAPSRAGNSISGKDLIAIISDPTWSSDVQGRAVEAATGLAREHCDTELRLQLLRYLSDRSHEDPHGDLRSLLFRELYPEHIAPEDVWRWFPIPVPIPVALVLCQSSPDHCRVLLDGLRIREKQANHFPDPSLAKLTWDLLAQAINAYDRSVDVTKLYDWIEFAAYDPTGWNHRPGDVAFDRVQEWLAQRPSIQKDLLLEFLERKTGHEVADEAQGFWQLVSGAGRPDDFHQWCMEQALAMSATAEDAARCLVGWAVEPIRLSASADEWLANALIRVGDDPVLTDQLNAIAENERAVCRRELEYATRRQDHRPSLADHVLKHGDALLTGAGPKGLLVALGNAYWGEPFNSQTRTGPQRLRDALASRQDAVKLALQALATVPTTDDGPSIAEIARMDSTVRAPSWAWPYLAGLDVIDRRGDDVLEVLGEEINRALWFYFTIPLGCEMPWFDKVLKAHPAKVANVIVALHRHRIRSKQDNASTLSVMAREERYGEATNLALPALMRAFPAKGYGAQLEMLRQVLALAIRYMPETVAGRVRNRMKVRRMNVAQRATWLGAGIAVASSEFVPTAVAFLEGGRASRTQHLIDALHSAWKAREEPLFDPESRASAVGALAHVLCAMRSPTFPTFLDKGSELIEHLVDCLASNPTHAAGLELESLSRGRNLEAWRYTIRSAREQQRILYQDAEYSVPSVEQVHSVLKGGPPANAADLVALVVDQLKRIGNDIRHGSTDDWQQYWNEEVHEDGKVTPPRPKRENSCRDSLLSTLNQRLPPGVDARREGSYAENTSGDVRVRYGSFGIPIEIKRGSDRKLWSAMRNQLMAKYARDPESAGHGVYVVFWFGADDREPVKTPPTGPRPKEPSELARRLEEELSPDERGRIKVVVIDVSLPRKRAGGR